MKLERFSQNFARFSSLYYISISAIFIGSFALNSFNVCLANTLLPPVLPTCFTVFGTITGISGRRLQIKSEQNNTVVHAQYSNATHFLKEEVVNSSSLKAGIDVQVLAGKEAELVILDPSDQFSEASSLGCRMPQTTSTPSGGTSLIGSQGTIQQVTDNTFTILPHVGQPKTFVWTKNTNFLQYTDYPSSQILLSGMSVILTGPIHNGVIIASRITIVPQGQRKGSLKQSCFLVPGTFVCDIISLGLLLLLV